RVIIMHIPDGFLTLLMSAIGWAVAISLLAFSFWRLNRDFNEKQIPLMAMLTAMFFAAQMVNYPIIGGTTAHLLGGPILAITLGPYAALVSMTVILLIQAFFFGDGGILTLGANIVNMGIVGVFIPWLLFIAVRRIRSTRKGLVVGAFLGAFLGDLAAAISAALMLGFSFPIFPYSIGFVLLVIGIHHSIIGVIEGLATVVILFLINGVRPDLLAIERVVPSITGDWTPKHKEVL
ncbi:MAG: energy-coupling factor ABC transporter permease, partial [Candidatus Thorarchaeota archaeon]